MIHKIDSVLTRMDTRTRAIFQHIVESYLDTGLAIGSRTLSKSGLGLSPASIRNVMVDLTEMGLLDAAHISAGRFPTSRGLRLFVDGFLENHNPSLEDKSIIDEKLKDSGLPLPELLHEASQLLSGLAGAAGLVASPKQERAIRHVEFVPLSTGEALCVLVTDEGDVENRLIQLPKGMPTASLVEAGNFLTARLAGRPLSEVRAGILEELSRHESQLDQAAAGLVEQGLAQWSGEGNSRERALIIKGRANLLNDTAVEHLDRVRELFDRLERQRSILDVLDSTTQGEGVRIFIGSDNPLFPDTGTSVIIAPYINASKQVIGALGVIGPTRLNYGRIIPMVDYTAKVLGALAAKER